MSTVKKELPATVESPIDENGIKTITSYKWGPNQELVKVTRKVQMEKVETPVLKRVLERTHIKPFGLPAGGNEGVTNLGGEDIRMEKNRPVEEEEKKPVVRVTSGIVCRFCKGPHLTAKCPNKDAYDQQAQKESAPAAAPAPSSGTSGKYVPPSLRNTRKTAEYKDEEEGVSIRISNIATDVDERELIYLFRNCGDLTRLRLICEYGTHKSRGFAFATYPTKEEADRAIQMYDRYALNHLLLSVTIAEKKKTTGPRYSTGYGKALPQNMGR